MIKTIVEGGINWNWYLSADFNDADKTVHVFYYDRWHKFEDRGSRAPKTDPGHISTIEGPNRILCGVRLNDVEYTVTNPQYVFGYKDYTHYIPSL